MVDDIKELLEMKKAATYELLENFAPTIEAYAKQNAPWTDRTGHARQGLKASADKDGNKFILDLSHSVRYGVYLEVAHGAKYAIIIPTLDAHISKIDEKLQEIWSDK